MKEEKKVLPPAASETFDVELQAVATISGKIFTVSATISKDNFLVSNIKRKSGGEIWPMGAADSLEYSGLLAEISARSATAQKVLKETSV